MFCGSEIATQRESSSNAYGSALTCSSTCSGTDSAAIGSMPTEPSSITGSPCCAATIRAIASLEASPSSISTCTTDVVLAFSRRTSNFASGIRPVCSSRSTTSSPMSWEIGAGVAGPFGAGLPSRLTADWADTAVASCQVEVGMEDGLAGEERDHRACGEEGGKRDRESPGALAVAGEQHDARDEGQEQAEHDPDRRRPAEHRADQERKLDVS